MKDPPETGLVDLGHISGGERPDRTRFLKLHAIFVYSRVECQPRRVPLADESGGEGTERSSTSVADQYYLREG